METAKVPVALSPVPGFCVKSRATDGALVRPAVSVDKGQKVFVNIAWDPNVPPPPPGDEDAIQRAMQGLDIDASDPEAWFVPIVLSDVRQDADKAGQPSVVFDCVLHPSIKSRAFEDADFKRFIIELAFQRIEAQTTLVLSRQIGMPNIASKGKPQSRRVLVPVSLYPPGHPNRQASPAHVQDTSNRATSALGQASPRHKTVSETRIPAWSWTQQGASICIVFDVPGVTHAAISGSTLDVEPRRVLLHIPTLYDLDLDLDAPDSKLVAAFGKNGTPAEAVKLKRMPSLDVDNARAEWRVADKAIVLLV